MAIRIVFTDPDALIERCQITDVAVVYAGEGDLDEDAVVPVPGSWRPLTPEQAAALRSGPDDDPATVIELVRPRDGWRSANAETPPTEHLAAFNPIGGHRADFLAWVKNPPLQTTTTIDESRDLRLGIHLDNFDKLPLGRRTESRRRLGLNLGPGVRHLLVGTLDIFEICRAAEIVNPHRCPHTDDIRFHVGNGRPFQVLRLRLDVGEAYIAPTELVPHDGSTQDADLPSAIAFWLGHWPVGTLPSLI